MPTPTRVPLRAATAATAAAVGATLAAVAAAAPALAADVPGGKNTTATLTVGSRSGIDGRFEVANDSDWYRVELKRGRDYACAGSVNIHDMHVRLRGPRGAVLRQALVTQAYSGGFEFRPAATGTHFAEYASAGGGPDSYSAWCRPNCRGDTRTRCRVAVGDDLNARLGFMFDADSYRASLRRGRAYTFAVTGYGQYATLLDANGRVLVRRDTYTADGTAVIAFTPEADGTYFLQVSVVDEISVIAYRLRLTSP